MGTEAGISGGKDWAGDSPRVESNQSGGRATVGESTARGAGVSGPGDRGRLSEGTVGADVSRGVDRAGDAPPFESRQAGAREAEETFTGGRGDGAPGVSVGGGDRRLATGEAFWRRMAAATEKRMAWMSASEYRTSWLDRRSSAARRTCTPQSFPLDCCGDLCAPPGMSSHSL